MRNIGRSVCRVSQTSECIGRNAFLTHRHTPEKAIAFFFQNTRVMCCFQDLICLDKKDQRMGAKMYAYISSVSKRMCVKDLNTSGNTLKGPLRPKPSICVFFFISSTVGLCVYFNQRMSFFFQICQNPTTTPNISSTSRSGRI